MPTYGYECKSCKHTFDVFQSFKDEPLKTCPKCGKAIRRLINGGTGVIFKGNGFYVTDNNKKTGISDKNGKSEHSPKAPATTGTETAPCAGCAKSETPACPKAAS